MFFNFVAVFIPPWHLEIYSDFILLQDWWTDLWLKEGFASFIEYFCVDHCFPEFDIWTQFVNQDLARALELDALKNSHPIEVGVVCSMHV